MRRKLLIVFITLLIIAGIVGIGFAIKALI